MKSFDFLVIGSGPAGHTATLKAAELGLKTCVIEMDNAMLGGVCLNEGCIPAKSLYHNASIFNSVRKEACVTGLDLTAARPDLPSMVEKSLDASKKLREGLTFLFKKNAIELVVGRAEFISRDSVKVTNVSGETDTIKAGKILIATGSSPRPLPALPFNGKNVISSSEAIRLREIPPRMLIIGAGAIGCEMASFFNLLGSKVTLVEAMDSVLPGLDTELSRKLTTIFTKDGIEVITSATAEKGSVSDKLVTVNIRQGDTSQKASFDVVLVSIGRETRTKGLKLDMAGVKVDEKGFIAMDQTMMTSIPGIYAAGDVIRTPMLAHVAAAEGMIAALSAAGKKTDGLDYDLIPNVVYTDTEVSTIGLTEEQAAKKGLDTAIGRQFFKANGRAIACSRPEGFIKVIADKKSKKILGAHIIGHGASELINEFAVAMKSGLTVDAIAETIHAHPTVSEIAIDACRAASR